jgi:hypothetical protein
MYRIVNTGELPITRVRVAFWVYGAEGAPFPTVGRNYVQASAAAAVAPGAEVEICTSLDDVFYYVPAGDVTVTNFRISGVDLGDGSVWSDPFSRFPYGAAIPTVEVTDAGS